MMKSKIFFTILILQLYAVTLANCADENDEEMVELESYNQIDTKITITTGLILSSSNYVACLYILVRTFLRWRQYKRFPMPMSLLFPFYIALIETGISILQIINWSYLVIGRVWEEPFCSIIGISSMFLLNFVMSLVNFIVFMTWYKVKRKTKFSFGRYDYIIFVITVGIAVFYTLLGVSEFGEGHAWCSFQSANQIILYLSLIINTLNLLSISILYVITIGHIKKTDNNDSNRLTYIPEKDISKKTLSYAPAYVTQSILLMIYTVSTMFESQHMSMDLIYILGMSICGILTAVQYIRNEGWMHKPITFSSPNAKGGQSWNGSFKHVTSSFRLTGMRFPFIKVKVDVVQQQIEIE